MQNRDERADYPGFGTLHVGKIKPHERVNPNTGEMEVVPVRNGA